MSQPPRYAKIVRAWCMYDWASSAFATTIMVAMFPPFYRSLVTATGLPSATATAYWGYTTAAALLLIAVVAPVLGGIADHTGGRKRYLGAAAGLGIVATAAFALLPEGTFRTASLLFLIANLGFAGANVFYESLLPHITRPGDMDRISTRGYAIGYIGGGLLLAVNVLWVADPMWCGLPDTGTAVRAAFLSVAIWWALFSIPLWRTVPDPPRPARARQGAAVRAGLARLAGTFRDIRRYRHLTGFLIAYWVYNDGIGTIIKMATAYGDEIGIGLTDMMLALLLTQFVGIPATLLFGRLARAIGARRSILCALAVYALIAIGGFFMRRAVDFYLLAVAVGAVQGGSQALSRSLFASMVPKEKASEFFGFFSTTGRLASVAGPVLFGVISQATGQSRLSILSLILFFALGAVLLRRVDVAAGVWAAQQAPGPHPGGAL